MVFGTVCSETENCWNLSLHDLRNVKHCTCGISIVFCAVWHCAYLSLHATGMSGTLRQHPLSFGKDCWSSSCMITRTSTTSSLPSICIPPCAGGESLWAVPLGVVRAHHPPVDPNPPGNLAPFGATCVPAARRDDQLRH